MEKYLTSVSIDASTKCQLRCPICSTSRGFIKNSIVGEGFLSVENFVQFVNKNPEINKIELSNWGEIFLNPEINDIIQFAYEKNIKLTAGNGVNFNSVSLKTIEYLVKYQFRYLSISIDGASQEIYKKYRVNGDFKKVIENIRTLNFYKQLYHSKYPILSWQYILFGHNESEIVSAKHLSKELNMKFMPKLNHSKTYSPIKNLEKVGVDSGLFVANREDYKIVHGIFYKRSCCQLWISPQINWNGELLGCCVNKWKGLGNVFNKGLYSSIESPLYKKIKKALIGELLFDESMPCYYCPLLIEISEQPISDQEIDFYYSQ